MKFLILCIFYLLNHSLATPLYEESEIAEKACLKEQQLTREEFYKTPKSERKLVLKCVYEKLGYIKDGIIQNDVILEKTKNSDIAIKTKYGLRLCSNIKPTNLNDLAYELDDCVSDISGEYFVKNWKFICDKCNEDIKLPKDEYQLMQYLPVKNITESMKLYAKCILKSLGFLKDNNLLEQTILEVIEDYKDAKYLEGYLKECKGLKEDNENDTAFKLYECMENIKDKYVPSTEDEYKLAQKVCLKEKELSPNEVYNHESPYKYVFANCVFEKMGYKKNGLVQTKVILDKYEAAKFRKHYFGLLGKCINSTESDDNYIDHDIEVYNYALCFDLFSGEHFLKDWERAGNECEDTMELIHDDQYPDMKMKNPTPVVKYYAACVWKKLNYLKANILQENVILEAADIYRDQEYLKEFLSKCNRIKENDHIDTAYKLYQCMDKIIEEHKKK